MRYHRIGRSCCCCRLVRHRITIPSTSRGDARYEEPANHLAFRVVYIDLSSGQEVDEYAFLSTYSVVCKAKTLVDILWDVKSDEDIMQTPMRYLEVTAQKAKTKPCLPRDVCQRRLYGYVAGFRGTGKWYWRRLKIGSFSQRSVTIGLFCNTSLSKEPSWQKSHCLNLRLRSKDTLCQS